MRRIACEHLSHQQLLVVATGVASDRQRSPVASRAAAEGGDSMCDVACYHMIGWMMDDGACDAHPAVIASSYAPLLRSPPATACDRLLWPQALLMLLSSTTLKNFLATAKILTFY